jgi:hypothetical protein
MPMFTVYCYLLIYVLSVQEITYHKTYVCSLKVH